MSRTVTTPPAAEPVTLERARRHLRVDDSIEDDDILDWVVTARQHVEGITEHAMMAQTWTESLDAMPRALELRGGNVRAIDSVTYLDQAGVEQTADAALYEVDLLARPPVLSLAPGAMWPRGRRWRVLYGVGYADASEVPRPLVSAVLLVLADVFENRGTLVEARLQENPAFSALTFQFTRVRP